VDLAQLGERDVGVAPLAFMVAGLGVNPFSGFGVPLYFEVLGKLLVPDRLAGFEELTHLLEDECVALDCGRVVRLLVPDACPDVPRDIRPGQSADAVQ
jgi:hypothetical protein